MPKGCPRIAVQALFDLNLSVHRDDSEVGKYIQIYGNKIPEVGWKEKAYLSAMFFLMTAMRGSAASKPAC